MQPLNFRIQILEAGKTPLGIEFNCGGLLKVNQSTFSVLKLERVLAAGPGHNRAPCYKDPYPLFRQYSNKAMAPGRSMALNLLLLH